MADHARAPSPNDGSGKREVTAIRCKTIHVDAGRRIATFEAEVPRTVEHNGVNQVGIEPVYIAVPWAHLKGCLATILQHESQEAVRAAAAASGIILPGRG